MAKPETPRSALVLAGRAMMFWRKGGMEGYLDLGVEDVLGRLDGLGADLARELHGQLCPLDRHHDGRGIAGLAGGERLRRARGLVLRVLELPEQRAEARARAAGGAPGGRGLVDGADRADVPLRAADRHGRIDRSHQRRRSRVLVNICLVACMAVTLAS